MRASKSLIAVGLGVFAFGVGYDAAATAGWIKGDGHDHTVSRVPVAAASASDATYTVISYWSYNTGEEISVPPRERRAKSVQAAHPALSVSLD